MFGLVARVYGERGMGNGLMFECSNVRMFECLDWKQPEQLIKQLLRGARANTPAFF